jgi:hypothetical protein
MEKREMVLVLRWKICAIDVGDPACARKDAPRGGAPGVGTASAYHFPQ